MDQQMELTGLAPHPAEEWERMLRFVALSGEERRAMAACAEALLRIAPRLVEDTYDYLLRVPETAAVLGWEGGADPGHLQERRRFFAIWLARTIGLDFSADFALYLFRAGKFHAGHGPRATHVPETYVAGSMGLVQAAFAAAIGAELSDPALVARALGGWSKYLSAQLNQMTLGYRSARALNAGALPIELAVFGRLRGVTGLNRLSVTAPEGAVVADVMRRFFDYVPQARAEVFDRAWRDHLPANPGGLWLETEPVYVTKHNWSLLHNGRDLRYYGGMEAPLRAGDRIDIFPPAR